MSWIEIIADRKIREAQDEGAFENLPGKGQPLKLEFDPRIPPEQRAAFRLMKEGDLLPDWIQIDKEIRVRQEKWTERVEAFARSRTEALEKYGDRRRHRAQDELDRYRDAFLLRAAEELREQNRMIDRLNLIVPSPSRQRLRLDLAQLMDELEARFPRFTPLSPGGEPAWRTAIREERPPTVLKNRMPAKRRKDPFG